MKKLIDYLHLYLGCEIDFVDDSGDVQTGKLIEVGYNSKFPAVIKYKGFKFHRDTEDLQLHLRPLSDMTEKEAKEVYTIKGENAFKEFEGETVKYLLSKHFDILGLIDAELAIAKATQKRTI